MDALRDPSSITKRQRQVIQLIAAGRSNEEVGRELGISPRTAKAHCDTLRLKLGVKRRRQIPLAYRLQTGDDPRLQRASSRPRPIPGLTAPRPWRLPSRARIVLEAWGF
jgi:DNA-binding CsgD family transcriptional regulator